MLRPAFDFYKNSADLSRIEPQFFAVRFSADQKRYYGSLPAEEQKADEQDQCSDKNQGDGEVLVRSYAIQAPVGLQIDSCYRDQVVECMGEDGRIDAVGPVDQGA